MVHVVILGGGFAGIAAAKTLLKKTKRSEVHVTLIDKNSYHLFTPSLYEVAASEEPQKNVCIPLHEILNGVQIVKSEIQKINKEKKEVQLKDQTNKLEDVGMTYDYLIIALGSEPEYHNIPGLAEYSIPFKTLEDAVKIRQVISDKRKEKSLVQVVVGGGGASGCEFAAELAYHLKNVKISLIQKSPQLVKELNMEAAKVAYKRLLDKDVEICFGERITKVFEDHLETDKNDIHNFDILIWAGGIKGNSVCGNLKVNEDLHVQGSENVFAAGDVANIQNEHIPQTVRVAKEQGKIAGLNIVHKLKKEPLEHYKFKDQIFIVPLVGKYAVVQFNSFLIKGFLGWVIQQLVFLRYLLSILPITKALKRWNRFEEYLMK